MATTSGVRRQLGPLLGLALGDDLEVQEALADLVQHPGHLGLVGVAPTAATTSAAGLGVRSSAVAAVPAPAVEQVRRAAPC